ncbi:class I SAM-dependent methyltransferase [Candidatus Nitrosotenuis chungbukensis]|uniref:class I SAM-dependent methyltransferase n=1 Tax=Candidatus Nitrosotenuis chungbukensis TaxID=1353246 RepID=UPI003B96778E
MFSEKRNPTWNVSCIDFDLEHVSTILKKHLVTPISTNFLQQQIGNNIDLITALHVVEHIPFDNLLIFFQNMRKALNPHGYLLLTTPNYLSPLAKFFDYHLVFPPVHQTILSVPG